jgi:hypothetical protein
VIDDYLSGTYVVLSQSSAPELVVIVDDFTLVRDLTTAATDPEVDDVPVEVRVSLAGRTRGSGELLAEIVFVVGQLGLGAAGNGVWVALEHLWRRVVDHPRPGRGERAEPVAAITRITVVVPTPDGEARVESVTVGPGDGAEVHRNVAAIVDALMSDRRSGSGRRTPTDRTSGHAPLPE